MWVEISEKVCNICTLTNMEIFCQKSKIEVFTHQMRLRAYAFLYQDTDCKVFFLFTVPYSFEKRSNPGERNTAGDCSLPGSDARYV